MASADNNSQTGIGVHSSDGVKKTAYLLGLAGLVPFAACAIIIVASGAEGALTSPAAQVFLTYSIAILSFLGGIRWGHALYRESQVPSAEHSAGGAVVLAASVLPPLVAWSTVFMTLPVALAVLLLAYCGQGAWDSFSAHGNGLPRWFAPLRMILTLVVALCHAAVFLVLAIG